jgi:hypothetical protein
VNNSGQIVGQYTADVNGGNPTYGLIYSNGVYTTLADPSGVGSTIPYGINNTGSIVGSDTLVSGSAVIVGFVAMRSPPDDFTGDGTSGVVLQHGGAVVDWIMKDGAYQSGNVLTTGAAGYDVVATGDFTGTGRDDVLL